MRLVALAAATAALLHGDTRCLPCHASYVQSWLATGMGRSVRPLESHPRASQTIRHERSGTAFRVTTHGSKLIHEASRGGRQARYTPDWVIGSGRQGESYIHRVQDALFQSPISWYAERRAFDMSPGFETDAAPDFLRPVTAECLFCHSGAVRPRPGTQNRYFDPPFQPMAIDCSRCHGDPSAHLANPKRQNIVNAARLTPELRDAVCEQCHLSGEARIPNPGRQFNDFRPGMRMEDVFSVYVGQTGADADRLKVVSHSEQMAMSRCSLKSSGKLWCASCHDPHAEPADKVAWYRQKCIACHASEETRAHERKSGRDCAGCHMPRLRPYDGGHTAFTDHWIRVRSESAPAAAAYALRAWREPAPELRKRNLALAYISAGHKSGDTNQMRTGLQLLGSGPADGVVETSRGMLLLRLREPARAVSAFRRAVSEQPNDSTRHFNLAVALLAAGDRSGALRHAEQAIALEPLLEDAYVLAAESDPAHAREWKARYLKLVPQRLLP